MISANTLTTIFVFVFLTLSVQHCQGSLFTGPSPSLFYPESLNPGCYKDAAYSKSLNPQLGILEHNWLGSAVDNWILKFLMEEQLGIGLKMVSSNDVPYYDSDDAYGLGRSAIRNNTLQIDLEFWLFFILLLVVVAASGGVATYL